NSSSYDKWPTIPIDGSDGECLEGWIAGCEAIGRKLAGIHKWKKVVALECYQGVNDDDIIPMLKENLPGRFFFTKESMHEEAYIRQMIYPDVTDDEVFGYMTRLGMRDFFDEAKVSATRELISQQEDTVTYLYGPG